MGKRLVTGLFLVLSLVATSLAVGSVAASAPAGQLVSEVAASGTPHVLNGRDLSVAQVGSTVLLGGTFTQARNDDSSTVLTRNRLLAFDATTGQISTTFNPSPNSDVNVVLPAGDGSTVYVAGNFTSIGGVARSRVARVRIADGTVVSTFNAGTISGTIRDLALSNGRLWLAGAFTHVNGNRQPALAVVDPTTGAFRPYMGLAIEGNHNGGVTQLLKIDINASGTRLVAVGNFDTLDLVRHHQMFMLDVSTPTATVANFNTTFYTSPCSSSFDSYMRDVDFSPDGTFFVVSTTGAYGGSTGACDQTSRWETGATGSTLMPSWTDYTGGDTTYGVEVTNDAVYVGGHFRWQNNPFAGDRAGQGAISRQGLAALDPLNGLPMTWDPTRTLGVGVFDFLSTSQGLWIASDTDRIGNFQYKGRIARMPRTGASFPAVNTPGLPNDVYAVAPTGNALTRRAYADGSVGASQSVPTGGIDMSTVRGAFMVNGWLYLARSDGSFTKRTFDGTTYGPSQPVATSDQIVPLTDWRADIQAATGMFFDSGRIYFTRTGSSQLFYRYFTPQSDVVGAKRLVASNNVTGIDFSQVRGMFGTGNLLYWATPNGALHRMAWQQTAQSGVPVAGTAAITSGPGVDANLWNARALFLYQDDIGAGAGRPPTASFTRTCSELTCAFDASGSTAPGGLITGYAWTFGDGSTGTGVSPSHTFAAAGTYPVGLTVTSNTGATASTSQSVGVTRSNQAPVASFTASCTGLSCTFDGRDSVDPGGSITSYAWDFGDGAGDAGATTSHTYAGAGARTVRLTVTDNEGATGTASQVLSPTAAVIAFRGASNSNRNAVTHTVTIPTNVTQGDTLLLALTVNTTAVTVPDIAGWTLLESVEGSNVTGRLWTRAASAGDAGAPVVLTLSATAKADLSLSAYHASGGTTVADHSARVEQVSGTTHVSPTVTVLGAGSWVSTYWSAKSSVDTVWSTPAEQTVRTSATGSGSGKITSVLTDSDGPVATGPAGGLPGTTSPAVSHVIMFTTVISLE
jgi:PKD repeat protein